MKQLLLALVAPLLACGDSTGAKVAVARIVLTASDTALAVTDTSTLNVVAYDAGGQVLAPADGSPTIDHATFTVQPSGSPEISDAHAIALATGPARPTAPGTPIWRPPTSAPASSSPTSPIRIRARYCKTSRSRTSASQDSWPKTAPAWTPARRTS